MKTLTDKQAKNLEIILDCIEFWSVNSRGIHRLWEQYKAEIEEIQEALYKDDKADLPKANNEPQTCTKHPDQVILYFGSAGECLECAEEKA